MSSNLNFPVKEYQLRIKKTQMKMQEKGLDSLIISDPSNMNWLTGYDGWSFYVHQAVILPAEGDPIWWGRGMDANGAKRTVFMKSERIYGYDDSYVQNPNKHPMLDLATIIKKRGLNQGKIGLEMDNYWFSASAFLTLKGELSVDFYDATSLVNWQRSIKSETEIIYMKRAAKIVQHMHEIILEKARVGLPKNELIAEVYHASVMGVDGFWGDYPSMVPMAPSGMDATAPHLTWDDKQLVEGETTFFEIAGAYKRYQCPQSRTLFLGKPSQKYLDAEKAVLEGIEVGLEMAKPGNQCQDIARAFNTTLNKLGFEKDSRCGYAIGVSYPPDWGERTMSFRDGDTSILKPGMTFHFMPALWLDDGGLEITEPFVITESGSECLCNTPRKMFVKD